MLACTTAPFAENDSLSIGEELLFHPNGAIAYLGGTAISFPGPNNELFIQWNSLSLSGGTLGKTFGQAKDSLKGWNRRNAIVYTVLGDPALSLPVPRFDLFPATGSGISRLNLENAGKFGDSAYFQLNSLGTLALNPKRNTMPGTKGWQLSLKGSHIILTREGRSIGIDGKSF